MTRLPPRLFLQTGLKGCYDASGREVPCAGSFQDGDLRLGEPLPEKRFETDDLVVHDRSTGLAWTRSANPFDFPLSWPEALEAVWALNEEGFGGYSDWRLPNRRELRSLVWHGMSRPILPADHPFSEVKQTWYWTSTSSAMYPACAWYLHLEGGRMFWGRKDQYFLVWPVRGKSSVLPRTGQVRCFDQGGKEIPCAGQRQDGALRTGAQWPEPRFARHVAGILDRLTHLVWHEDALIGEEPCLWQEALDRIAGLREREGIPWHLPNINELESLVDASRHSPALPTGHPFRNVQEVSWSSTTSCFATDWALALYLHKGAVGVGHKQTARFAPWPVVEAYRIEGLKASCPT